MSPLGFIASLLGSGFIALLFFLSYSILSSIRINLVLFALIAAAFGLLGSVVDSLLGATLQAQYTCVVTGRYTERSHSEGRQNILKRGFPWFTNDLVNFLATLSVTVAAALVLSLFR